MIMKVLTTYSILAALLHSSFICAKELLPEFSQFPAEAFAGPMASGVDLNSTPLARTYRSRLRAAFAAGPNFAGHYAFDSWGCGTECLISAVVNLKNGQVTFAPQAATGYEFKLDSRLLIANPKRGDTLDVYCNADADWAVTSKYFEWNGTDFLKIAEINWCKSEEAQADSAAVSN